MTTQGGLAFPNSADVRRVACRALRLYDQAPNAPGSLHVQSQRFLNPRWAGLHPSVDQGSDRPLRTLIESLACGERSLSDIAVAATTADGVLEQNLLYWLSAFRLDSPLHLLGFNAFYLVVIANTSQLQLEDLYSNPMLRTGTDLIYLIRFCSYCNCTLDVVWFSRLTTHCTTHHPEIAPCKFDTIAEIAGLRIEKYRNRLSTENKVRVAERSVEGRHSVINGVLKRAPAASVAYLSSELRFRHLKELTMTQPQCLKDMGHALQGIETRNGWQRAIVLLDLYIGNKLEWRLRWPFYF